jgi:small ligand-binding sensory domain FIST
VNRFAAALSTADFLEEAIDEVRESITEVIADRPDLLFVAATPAYAADADLLLRRLHEELDPRVLVGSISPKGVLGSGVEVEAGPGLSVWAASLPGATIEPFHALYTGAPSPTVIGWPELAGESATTLVVADSETFPMDAFVDSQRLNGSAGWLGGTVSGPGIGEARLLAGEAVATRGAVGLTITGLAVTRLVAHGARPIGPELVITAARDDLILELAGQPALGRLRELLDHFPSDERQLVMRALVLGFVIDENQPAYAMRDYLVRPVAADPAAPGAIRVEERPRVGQTVRFHVRDHRTAASDLEAVLADARERVSADVGGALMFACGARGSHIFAPRHDDAHRLRAALGVPTAGMFCDSEIGPIGTRTLVHELSATIALFPTDG